VGFKFGEFAETRIPFVHLRRRRLKKRARQQKKKKKRVGCVLNFKEFLHFFLI